jgi:flagellar protein FlaJ
MWLYRWLMWLSFFFLKKYLKISLSGKKTRPFLFSFYVVFFIFIGVIISLKKLLFPAIITSSQLESGTPDFSSEFGIILRNLGIIQAFFTGLVIGQIIEGNIQRGFLHSLILILVTIIFLTIF